MNRLASTAIAVEEGQTGTSGPGRPILRTEGLRKEFCSGRQEIVPLGGIDFSIKTGELIAIVGPSGSGKSTFLHLLAALDTPTSGAVYFAGNSLLSLAESELADYRNRSVGFVWQRHHLLPDFTAAENVAIPILVQGVPTGEALRTAEGWLGEVGLASRAGQRAGELSGGEQQRVAIARALVNGPVLLLADEPTGDLDERSAAGVFDLIERLHRSHRLTTILATHNLSLARRADRVLALHHGKLAPNAEVVAGEVVALRQAAGVRATDPEGLG
ncbi:MAG: ABC transporter ATP-binding protein [Candidatus Acidiferrales bacterium]